MLKEALEFLRDQGRCEKIGHHVGHEGNEDWLVSVLDGRLTAIPFERSPHRHYQFYTLKGLVEFLKSPAGQTDRPAVLFVGGEQVYGHLAYGTTRPETVEVNLCDSIEFRCLQQLKIGVRQKELWRGLVTDLDGCMDKALLAHIGRIKVSGKSESTQEIQVTGVHQTAGGADMIGIEFAGGAARGMQTADIPMDWHWKGRIWECFDSEFSIQTRLELDVTDKGLVFRFHPKRMDQLIRTAREALVSQLRTDLGEVAEVFEGEDVSDRLEDD